MKDQYEEEQQWINSRWLGHALKRLGFKMDKQHKRRKENRVHYTFSRKDVLDLAKRMNVEPMLELDEEEVASIRRLNHDAWG